MKAMIIVADQGEANMIRHLLGDKMSHFDIYVRSGPSEYDAEAGVLRFTVELPTGICSSDAIPLITQRTYRFDRVMRDLPSPPPGTGPLESLPPVLV
jgi:hypothetical protein